MTDDVIMLRGAEALTVEYAALRYGAAPDGEFCLALAAAYLAKGDKPAADEWQAALDRLPGGDRDTLSQFTFTFTQAQAKLVKEAIGRARAAGPFVDTGNENTNGNAVARLAEAYLGG